MSTRIIGAAAAAAAVVASVVVVSTRLATADPASHPRAASAPARPHVVLRPAKAETTFVPITPCRVADTRHGSALGHGATRSFYVAGTTGFTPQGGHAGGCGIPVGAASVSLTITALDETGTGALTVYPAGSARPLTRSLSFTKGISTTATSALPLRRAASPQLSVYNTATSGSTHLLLDVNGYFAYHMQALIDTEGGVATIYSASPSVLSVVRQSTGVADVTFDRDVSNCSPTATPYFDENMYADVEMIGGNKARVWAWVVDGATHLSERTDMAVYVTVTC